MFNLHSGFGSVGDLMFLHETQKEEVLRNFADSDPDSNFEDAFSAAFDGIQDDFTESEIEQMREECLAYYEDRTFN